VFVLTNLSCYCPRSCRDVFVSTLFSFWSTLAPASSSSSSLLRCIIFNTLAVCPFLNHKLFNAVEICPVLVFYVIGF
jgi:hypothetical protein